MFPDLTQEFRSTLPLDNSLLIADIKNGQQPTERDILDVVVNARALFTMTTLTCRELGTVQTCFGLWAETRELFARLFAQWSQVAASDYPQVDWLVTELERLQALCDDRCELYTVSEQQRLRHVETRGDVDIRYSFTERHGVEPQSWTSHSTPQHVYRIGHF